MRLVTQPRAEGMGTGWLLICDSAGGGGGGGVDRVRVGSWAEECVTDM